MTGAVKTRKGRKGVGKKNYALAAKPWRREGIRHAGHKIQEAANRD